jgi:pilus assembly protein CpaB
MADPPGTELTVAAHDLPSGHTIVAADLRTVRIDSTASPSEPVSDPVGLIVAGAMRQGEPFTDRRVLTPRDLPDGTVLATVPVEAAATSLLRVGDVVDVICAGDDAAQVVLATSTPIVVLDQAEESAVKLGVAVKPDTATAIARAALSSQLTVVAAAAATQT